MKAEVERYARALADVTLERGTSEQVKMELAEFVKLLEESADLRNFLASPAVARMNKHGVVGKLVSALWAGETLRNFLLVVVDNRRTGELEEIQRAYEKELQARLGITRAEVASAAELSADEKARLTQALEKITGRRVEAEYRLDPGLIGGAVARVGSSVYDGSVRSQLERLRARLASE